MSEKQAQPAQRASTKDVRARLRVAEATLNRLIVFDGGAELMPWVHAHKRHKGEPVIDCPFCHDQFVPAAEARELRRLLDHFDRYASVPDATSYNGSPFQAEVRAALSAALEEAGNG